MARPESKPLNGMFDKLYLINLAECVERRNLVTKQLRKFGVDVDSDIHIHGVRPTEKLGFPSIKVRGCFMSHLDVLKHALDNNFGRVAVLEDDVMFSHRLFCDSEKLRVLLDETEWDIVVLGWFPTAGWSACNYYGKIDYDDVIFQRTTLLPGGMHFYAVNGRILSRLVSYFDETMDLCSRGDSAIRCGMNLAFVDDVMYYFSLINPDVKYLIACPSLAWQRGGLIKDTARKVLDRLAPSAIAGAKNASISNAMLKTIGR